MWHIHFFIQSWPISLSPILHFQFLSDACPWASWGHFPVGIFKVSWTHHLPFKHSSSSVPFSGSLLTIIPSSFESPAGFHLLLFPLMPHSCLFANPSHSHLSPILFPLVSLLLPSSALYLLAGFSASIVSSLFSVLPHSSWSTSNPHSRPLSDFFYSILLLENISCSPERI